MEDLLLFSDIDQNIQDQMGNKYPSSDKRLRAINSELKTLRTKYNIFTSRKSASISVITDGSTAYNISDVITDDDVEEIIGIRLTDNVGFRFVAVDEDKFNQDTDLGRVANQYTLFYEDGEQKIKVSTINNSSTTEDLTCIYLTRALGEGSTGTQIAEMTGASGEKVYLPYKYLDLLVLGSMKRLWYQATGDESQTQMAITSNRYKSELTKLGLSDNADMIRRNTTKLKIRGW
jgi:hypothetical protein